MLWNQPWGLKVYCHKLSRKSFSTRFINRPSHQLTSHQVSSRKKSFLNSLWTRSCKGSWVHFWNRSWKPLRKSIIPKLYKRKSLNSVNSISTFSKLKTKSLLNTTRMISSLFTVISPFLRSRMFFTTLKLVEFNKSLNNLLHFSNNTTLISWLIEQFSPWTNCSQISCSTCLISTLIPNQRSDCHKTSFSTF